MLFRPTALRTAVMAPLKRSTSWSFSGTHWLTSPGGAGDYAFAANSAAARVVFPSASPPTATIAFWAKDWTAEALCVGDADGLPSIICTTAGEIDVFVATTSTTLPGSPFAVADPSGASWAHFALVMDGTNLNIYGNGTNDFGAFAIAGTYAASDTLRLFRNFGAATSAGSIRSLAIWDRALSGAQVAALNTGGVSFDVRTVAGGGPVHWWPADGDSGTVVTDRGSDGTCNLTLAGSVTIGS